MTRISTAEKSVWQYLRLTLNIWDKRNFTLVVCHSKSLSYYGQLFSIFMTH